MIRNLQSERVQRVGQRFGINAALTVIKGQSEIPGFTRDLSNRGVYFYLDLADNAPLGGNFEFVVELPPEITLSTGCFIRCEGRVVRTERASGQLTGIAAEILHYSFEESAAVCD
ncbi:MAG: PilZ domain-containing protein [Terracidiphilus sp.]